MTLSLSSLFIPCATILALALPLGASAQASDQSEARRAVERTEEVDTFLHRLEWRSVVSVGANREFGLFDPETKYSFWVSRSRAPYGIEIARFDAEANRLILRIGKHTRELQLAKAGATPAPRTVNVIPVAEDDPAANEVVNPDEEVPMVRLIAPSEGDPLTRVSMEEMESSEDAPVIEMNVPVEDDEMRVGADG